jgi:predicted dehydrogenase
MSTFTTYDFRKRVKRRHSPPVFDQGGHGGGDMGLIRSFINAIRQDNKELLGPGTSVDDVLRAHLVVFAAEKSRREGTVVNVSDFERDLREQMAL